MDIGLLLPGHRMWRSLAQAAEPACVYTTAFKRPGSRTTYRDSSAGSVGTVEVGSGAAPQASLMGGRGRRPCGRYP